MFDLRELYTDRYANVLQPLASNLQRYCEKQMKDLPRIDRVSVRAKSVESFLRKAQKRDENGAPKYPLPLDEIQDQLGARITTFYLRDVSAVEKFVEAYFPPIEKKRKEPESSGEFGYEGYHYILFVPDDIIPKELANSPRPNFFELQIKTLFQHAWSESAHDLFYKPELDPTRSQRRRGAFTAAQAWGADQIFDELAEELGR